MQPTAQAVGEVGDDPSPGEAEENISKKIYFKLTDSFSGRFCDDPPTMNP
jgi:hypothetical protein